jgi:hypothetical protein
MISENLECDTVGLLAWPAELSSPMFTFMGKPRLRDTESEGAHGLCWTGKTNLLTLGNEHTGDKADSNCA